MIDSDLDVVIPVFNEGRNIHRVLDALHRDVAARFRVLICYDFDDDDTLAALRTYPPEKVRWELVRNRGHGPHGAVMTGLQESSAPAVVVYPADDDVNSARLDAMAAQIRSGCDIACASRFISGGAMVGCPPLKAVLVRAAAFTLFHIARAPTHDATNGFRMFSQRVIREIPVESTRGFTYSLELLAKVHRLRWRVGEVPARWQERGAGQGSSRFHVLRWAPAYLRWYFYVFATTFLRRRPATVPRSRP